jgi:hypothetical protein
MNTKILLIIFALEIIAFILGLVTLNPEAQTRFVNIIMPIICFTLLPLFIKLFIFLQVKIGHGEWLPIKWLQAHETAVIFGAWIFLIIGFCIAIKDDVSNYFK